MTCVDCHDPHQFERRNSKVFSQRCLECHKPEHASMTTAVRERLGAYCADCHMRLTNGPKQHFDTDKGRFGIINRDHLVRIVRSSDLNERVISHILAD